MKLYLYRKTGKQVVKEKEKTFNSNSEYSRTSEERNTSKYNLVKGGHKLGEMKTLLIY